METMTKREFLTEVAALENEKLANYAKAALEKMAADAEKRKGRKSEKEKAAAAEKDAFAIHVAETYLTAEARTATDVMNLMNETLEEGAEPYKVQAVSAVLRRAVSLGVANVQKVKIPKKGEQNGYTVVM